MRATKARRAIDLGTFLVALLAIGISVAAIAHHPSWRGSVDATKTRAYSLSDQTRRLLEDLQRPWSISLVVVEAEVDRAIRRQVDEILARFQEASPNISVETIDPTDPASLDEYEGLLRRLREVYGAEVASYDDAIGRGQDAMRSLLAFAASQEAALREVASTLPPEMPAARQLAQVRMLLERMGSEWGKIPEAVDEALATGEARPLPDYETARSTLAAALSYGSEQMSAVRTMLEKWATAPGLDAPVREYAEAAAPAFERHARELAAAADPLRRLRPLELSRIGKALGAGEAAVVIGPDRAGVIPSSMLLPKRNFRAGVVGVSFDQRFRGEQVLASTIRALRMERMPRVVFVHAQPGSMFQKNPRRTDLVGVKAVLEGARFRVEEWMVGKAPRPVAEPGETIVWVVVPPPLPDRTTPQPTEEELALIREAETLVREGEPVLLTLVPSFLPGPTGVDPWSAMVERLGFEVATDRVVLERTVVEGGERRVQTDQDVVEFDAPHPIARALDGLPTRFGFVVPLGANARQGAAWKTLTIAAIEPSAERWIEEKLIERVRSGEAPESPPGLEEPVPVVLTATRSRPNEDAEQRVIVTGSSDWIHSGKADVAVNVGGGRMALVSPGNVELLQASVAWLAGLEDLIAQTPASRQVSRLEGLSPEARTRWGLLLIAGLPAACLSLGAVTWAWRRRW